MRRFWVYVHLKSGHKSSTLSYSGKDALPSVEFVKYMKLFHKESVDGSEGEAFVTENILLRVT